VEANDLRVWRSTTYGEQGPVGGGIYVVDDEYIYLA
jgi:hypothetical protein